MRRADFIWLSCALILPWNSELLHAASQPWGKGAQEDFARFLLEHDLPFEVEYERSIRVSPDSTQTERIHAIIQTNAFLFNVNGIHVAGHYGDDYWRVGPLGPEGEQVVEYYTVQPGVPVAEAQGGPTVTVAINRDDFNGLRYLGLLGVKPGSVQLEDLVLTAEDKNTGAPITGRLILDEFSRPVKLVSEKYIARGKSLKSEIAYAYELPLQDLLIPNQISIQRNVAGEQLPETIITIRYMRLLEHPYGSETFSAGHYLRAEGSDRLTILYSNNLPYSLHEDTGELRAVRIGLSPGQEIHAAKPPWVRAIIVVTLVLVSALPLLWWMAHFWRGRKVD